MTISVVIPNFNGLSLLKTHLPSVIKHAALHEIIVIDDASSDESANYVAHTYPQIILIKNHHNLGFVQSVNLGFDQASHPLVLLLNSDVSINSSTIPNLVKKIDRPEIFAVGCLEKLPGGRQRGKSAAFFSKGLFMHRSAKILSAGPTAWVFGASGLYKKSLWQNLHGLDPLFYPAYYEDLDICYRAWKNGYTCVFEPSATVKHQTEATMRKVLNTNRAAISFKNQLLFTWKNITDAKLLAWHYFWLPYHLLVTSIITQGAFIRGFLLALKQLPQIIKTRSDINYKLSDQQVLALFGEIT